MGSVTENVRGCSTQYDYEEPAPLSPVGLKELSMKYSQYAEQLQPTINGDVLLRYSDEKTSKQFEESVRLFNSAAPLRAWMVARPKNTDDVVIIIKFCRTHGLSPSVKSGGFSTAGWSIQGDLVIDMRLMDDIRMMLPNTAPQTTVLAKDNPFLGERCIASKAPSDGDKATSHTENISQMASSSPSAEAHNSEEHLSNVKMQGSGTYGNFMAAEADGASTIDQEAHGPEYDMKDRAFLDDERLHLNGARRRNAGEAFYAMSPETDGYALGTKRKVEEQDDTNHQSLPSGAAAPSLFVPRTQRRESGAEADIESSHNAESEGSGSFGGGVAGRDVSSSSHSSDEMNRRGSGEPESPKGNSGPKVTSWAENGFFSSATDAGEGSSGSNSRSDTNSNHYVTSVDADSDDAPKADDIMVASSDELPRPDTNVVYEHERWQQHHNPPGSQGSRLVLPESGGFIWKASSDDSGASYSRPLSGPESMGQGLGIPGYSQGSTFRELHGASSSSNIPQYTGVSSHLANTSLRSPDSAMAPLSSSARWTDPTGCSHKPGIYKDQYVLCSFGPGVGVRGIDCFTDSIDRSSELLEPNSTSKGKAKVMEPSLPMEDVQIGAQGMQVVANRLPYHVPLSAFPVGSTAMTTGGFGYLTRAYGLSVDNMVEAELVLADGRVMILNDDSKRKSKEEADLWWAVRGAGPCFGIITRIIAKAYPVPKVYAGNLIYPLNPITAPSLVRHWRDCLKGGGGHIPRELYSNLILTAGPDQASDVVVIQICYLGSRSEGEAFVQTVSSWTGERVLFKDIEERSFLSQQDGVAQVLKNGKGRRWMVRGDLIETLTDEVIGDTLSRFTGMGNRAVWIFELVGGAVEDVEEDETCIGARQRNGKFSVGALQQWTGESEDERCSSSVESWVREVLSPVSVGGPYPCFLERREQRKRVEGSFGKKNFERLLGIKRQVDPEGLFKHTFARGLTLFATESQS